MATTIEYAQLSASAYEAGGAGNTNANWIRLENAPPASVGFSAATFQNTATGEIVIAYRGNDGPFDVVGDIQLVAGQVPLQFRDAQNYYNTVVQQYGVANVSVTGQSFGGAMGSFVAANSGGATMATVFNAAGIANLVSGDPSIYTNITNYNANFDIVSHLPFANQIGNINTVSVDTLAQVPVWYTHFLITLGPLVGTFATVLKFFRTQHGIDNLLTSIQDLFHQAEITRSPLVLDLNGDGVSTVAMNAGVHFDHNNNSFSELSGWVNKDDGLLVRDLNGNGQIDGGGELFGDNTLLANGQNAANGFASLAEMDGNHDGTVDSSEATAAGVQIWKDANQNGLTEAGELLTLNQAGVSSLATGYTATPSVDAQGNTHGLTGSYTTLNGDVRAMDDVWFAADTARTIEKGTVAIPAQIAALPDMAGFGNVHSLHQAMARDTTGHLQSLVEQFMLASLEALLGESYIGVWCWGTPDPNPHGPAANDPMPLAA